MKSYKVLVTVDGNVIRVEPDTLTMTAEDEVQWEGRTARKFSVLFDGEGPFGSRELAYSAATTRQRPRATGRFKYSVVSEENSAVRLDPVIIVDEPPSNAIG